MRSFHLRGGTFAEQLESRRLFASATRGGEAIGLKPADAAYSDLVISQFEINQLSRDSGTAGSSVILEFLVENPGAPTTSNPTTLNIRLGTSFAGPKASDPLLATVDIDPIRYGSADRFATVTIPAGTSPGLKYFWATVDPDHTAGQGPNTANDNKSVNYTVLDPATAPAFTAAPTDTPAGVPIDSNGGVQVTLRNADDSTATDEDGPVTLAIRSGPAGAALGGTAEVDAVNGIATFKDLTLNVAGQYTLTATDDNGTAAVSAAFTVGPIELQGSFVNGKASGKATIGLTPAAGGTFVPLLQETAGSVSYAGGAVSAAGTFTASQAGLGGPLFTGNIAFPAGGTTTASMAATPVVKVAGLPTTFSNLTLATGALRLAGDFTLPAKLGGFKIPVSGDGDDAFTVDPAGLALHTGPVSVTATAFSLDGLLEVSAKSLSVDYASSTHLLKIQGDFALSLKSGGADVSVEADLAGNNFIQYDPDWATPTKIVADFTYASPAGPSFFHQWFSITQASLHVDSTVTSGDAVTGMLILKTKSGTINGTLGFAKDGYINTIAISGSGLAIPLEPPGLFLQSVGGSITGVAPNQTGDTTIIGALGFSYGTLVAAGTADGTATVVLDSTNKLKSVTVKTNVDIASGKATGSATLSADFEHQTFGLTELKLQGFDNRVSLTGSLVRSGDGSLDGTATGAFKWKDFCGGISVTGSIALHIDAASDPAKSYLKANGSLSIFHLASVAAGVEYDFDGSIHSSGVAILTKSGSSAVTVPAGEPYLLLSDGWTKAAANAPFQVVAPDGTVYASGNLDPNLVTTVPGLSGPTQLTVAVNNPAPGTWRLVLTNPQPLGTLGYQGFAPPPAQTATLSGFTFDDTNKNGTCDAGETKTSGKTVFLDSNNNGKLDSGEKSVVTGSGGVWSFAGLAAGTYHVRRVFPAGYTQSNALIDVTLTAGQVVSGLFIGSRSGTAAATGSIAGFAFNDVNRNGLYDGSDTLAAGKTIFLDADNDGLLDAGETSIVTDSHGNFAFKTLATGTYRMRRVEPSGYVESTPLRTVTLTAGQAATGVSIGSKTK